MAKYKVIIKYPDGTKDKEVFDTEWEAEDYAQDCVNGYRQGAEDLALMDGSDDDDWGEDITYKIKEIKD